MKEEGRHDPYSRCSLANRIRAVTSIRQQNKMVYRHPSIRPPLPKNRYFCPFLIAISDFHSICRLHRFRSAAELANAARCIDRGGGQATRGCATRGWRTCTRRRKRARKTLGKRLGGGWGWNDGRERKRNGREGDTPGLVGRRGEDRGFDKKKGNEKQMTVQGRGCVFGLRERLGGGDRLWRRWWTSDGETKGKIMENWRKNVVEGREKERERGTGGNVKWQYFKFICVTISGSFRPIERLRLDKISRVRLLFENRRVADTNTGEGGEMVKRVMVMAAAVEKETKEGERRETRGGYRFTSFDPLFSAIRSPRFAFKIHRSRRKGNEPRLPFSFFSLYLPYLFPNLPSHSYLFRLLTSYPPFLWFAV